MSARSAAFRRIHADLTDDEQAGLLRRRDELLVTPDLAQPMDDHRAPLDQRRPGV